ncbi:MAG: DUF2157 domain-containing protein [Pseudomonadota bacterium]
MGDEREQALSQIIALASAHDITLEEIAARRRLTGAPGGSGKWLMRVLGYTGGALIFGGLVMLMGMIWDDLNSPARVAITYGSGLTAFLLGLAILRDERLAGVHAPLFLMSALLLPAGMFIFLKEYGSGGDPQLAAMLVFGILAAQFLGAFLPFRRTILLFFGVLFWNAVAGILMEMAEVPGEFMGIALGISIMATAWRIDTTPHCVISPFLYCLGSLGLLWSVFDLVEHTPIDTLFLFFSAGMMYLSVRMHSRALLIISTGALLGFLGYYTEEYFTDVTGWPVALMIMGLMLLGVSAWAIKLDRRIRLGGVTT